MITNASFLTTHFIEYFLTQTHTQCDISTKDDNIHEPLLAAAFFGDDHFIAVFNVSDSICIFQAPGTAVANGKVTLPVGKNLKEVWPDLELEKIVHFAVIVSDKHGGHYMLFHYEATDDEYDIPLRTDVIVDLVTNKVHEGHLPKMFTFPLSTKEPMTMYNYAQFYGSGYLKRAVYPGHRVTSSSSNPFIKPLRKSSIFFLFLTYSC